MGGLEHEGSARASARSPGAELEELRALVDAARIGLWAWDMRADRVFYSTAWKRQLGIEEDLSDSLDEWASRVHPDDVERMQAQMEAVFASDATEGESHFRMRHTDGSYRDILAQSTITRDEDGRPIRLVGSHIDLTDARARDRSLFAVSARLVEATPETVDGIIDDVLRSLGQLEGADRCYLFLWNRDRGTVDNTHEWCAPGIEPQIRRLQDLAVEELPWFFMRMHEKVVVNVVVDELPDEAAALRRHLQAQAISSVLAIPLYVGEQLFGFLGFDAVRARRRFTRENEDLLRIVGEILVSAIRRVRAERQGQAHERRRQEALRSLERAEAIAGIGSWRYDPSEDRSEWSPEMFRIFGRDPRDGGPSAEAFRRQVEPDSFEAWAEAHRAAVQRGRPFELALAIRRPDGAVRWIEAHGEADPEPGPAGYAIRGVIRDITEARRVEEERVQLQAQLLHAQKMESIGRLAGGVAHDFNNMLGVIQGNLELALDTLPDDHAVVEDLREVERAAQRSADLTRMLLTFARRRDTEPRQLDPAEALKSPLGMLQRLVPEPVQVRATVREGVWPIHVDPAHFDQILINLGVNARDALDGPGTIALELANVELAADDPALAPGAEPGSYVRLTVRDDGRGMDAVTRQRVFEPYFTTKAIGAGTGLGLATVYGLVQQAGGMVTVESEPGGGASFHVFFPRSAREDAPSPAREVEPPPPSRGEKVLLVEDEPSLAALTERMLTRLGYEVLCARTPREAIELVDRAPESVQALVTDVVMPDMNGRRLAEVLQSRHLGLRVLFMSGYASEIIDGEQIKVLAKPFSTAELAAALREVLDAPPARVPAELRSADSAET